MNIRVTRVPSVTKASMIITTVVVTILLYTSAYAWTRDWEWALALVLCWVVLGICGLAIIAAGYCKYSWWRALNDEDWYGVVVLPIMAVAFFVFGVALGVAVIKMLSCMYC